MNTEDASETPRQEIAFLFDLDGTLVDSVYQHVLAWREALESEGIDLSVWSIHRKVGMSGGLFANVLLRETGLALDQQRIERLQRLHAEAYRRNSANVRPLPGAQALLTALTHAEIPRRSPPVGGGRQPVRCWRRSAST